MDKLQSKYTAVQNDLRRVREQLGQIRKEGHLIYLHLHPHWVDAAYDPAANMWNLANKSHFSLHQVPSSQREKMFTQSYETLAELVGDATYRIEGFRAGGLYVQPFVDFYPSFIKHNIKYDFSVLRGAVSHEDEGHGFDFSTTPASMVYKFSTHILEADVNGLFTEFSVNSIQLPMHYRILNRAYNELFSGKEGRGKLGDGLPAGNKISRPEQKEKRKKAWETLAVENISPVKEIMYRSEAGKHGYLHMISHPKLISRAGVKTFDLFLKRLKDKYKVVTDLPEIAARHG